MNNEQKQTANRVGDVYSIKLDTPDGGHVIISSTNPPGAKRPVKNVYWYDKGGNRTHVSYGVASWEVI